MRWLWKKKTNPGGISTELQPHVHPNVAALFSASVYSAVGDGTNTLFWMGRLLHDDSIAVLAPTLSRLIPSRIQRKRTVLDTMFNLQMKVKLIVHINDMSFIRQIKIRLIIHVHT